MIRLSDLVSSHVLIYRIVVLYMDDIIVGNRSSLAIPEPKLDIHRSCSILDEVNLHRLDGIQGFVISFLCSCFLIYPCVISRNDECVIIKQQHPHRLFNKFRCGHERIRIVKDILDRALDRYRIIV